MLIPLCLTALAYVLGATPTSYWVGKAFHGVDLRTVGSGNLGATNTFRTLGAKAAFPVMVFDIFKGWAPVALFPLWFPEVGGGWIPIFGAAAIVGHVFSFWVGFRGGKGVATSCGVFIALAPWATLIAFGVWLVVVVMTRYVSLGSILAAISLSIAIFFTPHEGGRGVVALTLALALFVIWAHRTNIGRLLKGEESRIGVGRTVGVSGEGP